MSEMKRTQLVLGNKTLKEITDDICAPVERLPSKEWVALFLGAKTLFIFYILTIAVVEIGRASCRERV